jgi:hypothetical protein
MRQKRKEMWGLGKKQKWVTEEEKRRCLLSFRLRETADGARALPYEPRGDGPINVLFSSFSLCSLRPFSSLCLPLSSFPLLSPYLLDSPPTFQSAELRGLGLGPAFPG